MALASNQDQTVMHRRGERLSEQGFCLDIGVDTSAMGREQWKERKR
jgi:hypothetical protein